MGRIKKTAGPKHEATLSPALASFVSESCAVPLFQLRQKLSSLPPRWPFPRGDLYHWIPLLNRFDWVLEEFNKEYGLKDGPQARPFERRLLSRGDSADLPSVHQHPTDADLDKWAISQDGDRELVESILAFSLLLLENCGNRTLYSSSDHLNDLLHTTSLSLLSHTLRLGVRCAQRYYASRQRSVGQGQHLNIALLANHYNLNLDRVYKLAVPFVRPPSGSDLSQVGNGPASPTRKGKEKNEHAGRGFPHTVMHATDLVSIARASHGKGPEGPATQLAESDNDWETWGRVWLSYYAQNPVIEPERRKSSSQIPANGQAGQPPTTPTPIRRTTVPAQPSSSRRNRLIDSSDSPSATESSPQSPAEKSADDQGSQAQTIVISSTKVATTPSHKLVASTIGRVPEESQYDLLHRIRVASALIGSTETRQEILGIRILAITNLAYVYPETIFQQKILQQDADEPRRLQLAYQLAELVHPPEGRQQGIPRWLQTLAFGGLEALAKHKTKLSDVCTALSINVNHGVFLYVLRKAVSELAEEEDEDTASLEEDEWREALFTLLIHFSTAIRVGETLVSAGIVPVLLEVLSLRTRKAERAHPKILMFIDTIIYHVREAFQAVANARGLDLISELTAWEVESGFKRAQEGKGLPKKYRNQITDYEVPYFQQQTLRWLFKSMNHMMSHGGGNFDRLLRNFIDSPKLLGGLRTVLVHATVFGSNVWSGAVNILSNFIHNEPTSYAVIAEAGLSRAFLEAVCGSALPTDSNMEGVDNTHSSIAEDQVAARDSSGAAPLSLILNADLTEPRDNQSTGPQSSVSDSNPSTLRDRRPAQGILPATDAIVTVPQAFGAICLSSAGMRLFQSSPALERFFEIFVSPEHVKCLKADPDLASILGGSFDELVRHHPPLREAVMRSILSMIGRVTDLCNSRALSRGTGAKIWVQNQEGKIVPSGGRDGLLGIARRGGAVTTMDNLLPGDQLDAASQSPADVMEGIEPGNSVPHNVASPSPQGINLDEIIEKDEDKLEPSVSTYLDVTARFLAGYFSNTSLCSTFIEACGAELLLDLTTIPSLPSEFNSQPAAQSLARVTHILVEQKPHLVLPSLLRRTREAVGKLEPFYNSVGSTAFFSPFLDRDSSHLDAGDHHDGLSFPTRQDQLANGTVYVKALVEVHTLCNILCHTFSQPMYNQRSSSSIFNQVNLTDMYVELSAMLGSLRLACVWEEILLEKSIPETWKTATRIKTSGIGSHEASDLLGILTSDNETSEFLDQQILLLTGTNPPAADARIDQDQGVDAEAERLTFEQESKSLQFKNFQTLRYLLSQIPLAITPFFQGLGRILLPKRQIDTYQKQNAATVAEAIAESTLRQLRPSSIESIAAEHDKNAYWIVMLTTLSRLMIEAPTERLQPQCLTLLLQAFKNQGGFAMVEQILETFLSEIRAVEADEAETVRSKEVSMRLACCYGGIKIILNFFSQVVSSKNIIEAHQTTAMASRDRDKDKPDYFSAAQFIVELRLAVLPVVSSIWNSDFIDKASSSITKCLIDIMRTILEGEHEGGANKRTDKISRRDKAPAKSWKENTESRERLIRAGYDKDLIREALYRCNNYAGPAEDYCKLNSRPERSMRFPVPEKDALRRHSRNQTRVPGADARDEDTDPIPDGDASSIAAGPSSRENQPSPENQPVALEDIDADAFRAPLADYPGPPIETPLGDLQPENEGFLAMSIDNLLGNLTNLTVPTPTGPEGLQESSSRDSVDAASVPPSRDDKIEAGNVLGAATIEDLEEARDKVRADLVERCLNILNVHSEVTFELADLIIAALASSKDVEAMRSDVCETLVSSLVSLQQEDDFRPAGKKIAAYSHFLGLILQKKSFFDAALGELRSNFSTLLGFIRTFPDQALDQSSPWVGQVLLIIEKMLAEDAQPRQITWIPPQNDADTVDTPIAQLEEPVISTEERAQLFDAIIEVLPRTGKDASLALSVARALAILTRDRALASRLGERRNLQRLFVMVKQLAGTATESLHGTIMIVLRHIIEDESTLKQIMRSEIRFFFENRQSARHVDTNSYVRNLYHLVLRAPEIFVEVSSELLQLVKFDPSQRHQTLVLKDASDPDTNEALGAQERPEEPASEPQQGTVAEGDVAAKRDETKSGQPDLNTPILEKADGVVHYLLCELLSYKDVEDKDPTKPLKDLAASANSPGPLDATSEGEAQQESTSASEPPKSDRPEFKPEQHPIYIYRCFILQCLTELLCSYNCTKLEFISFSRKAPSKVLTPSKPRSGILNYLLNDVLPVGTLAHAEDIAFRKRFSTSNWAMAAIVSLCSRTGEQGFDKKQDPANESDLLFVRKFVLEHMLKAYKDANASNEPLDGKYARMLNLADLINRMLTGRPNSGGTTASAQMLYESQKQLAKLMFEKNFISALTNSIADVDLNYPSSSRAVKYILRPLKLLTQTAIDLSESSDVSLSVGQTEEDEISSATSVSEFGEDREETPDLFRNSTLGMFEAGREPESTSESSEDDEEMYDEEYGDEVEYGDEMQGEDDDVVSDEDEELGNVEGLPGDVGLDVEVVLHGDEDDDDDEGDSEEDDEDSDDMDEMDDGEDIEILDELNGDDGGSDPAGQEEEWSDDDDDDFNEDQAAEHEDEPHIHQDSPLDHIVRALEGHENGDLLQHLQGGEMHMDLDAEGYMEDEIEEDEENDDDEDEGDDEEPLYELDDDMRISGLPWGWEAEGELPVMTRGHENRHRGGVGPWDMHPRGHRDPNLMVSSTYRSHRPTGSANRAVDDGTNPLLQRSTDDASLPIVGRGTRHEAMSDWITAIDAGHPGGGFHADSPVSIINNLISAIGSGASPLGGIHQHGGALHFRMSASAGAGMPREVQAMLGLRRTQPEIPRHNRDDPAQAVRFEPASSTARWQDEARLMFGPEFSDKTHRVINALLSILVPPAIAKERRLKLALEVKIKLEQEELKKAAIEEDRKAKEKAEKEAQEHREAQEREAAGTTTATETILPIGDEEVGSVENVEDTSTTGDEPSTDTAMEGVEAQEETSANDETEAPADGATEDTPATRVRTTIRGRELDITDMDIDPDYLDALPEELREEVLMHQIAERRSQAAASGEQPTDISREFLEALPDDIRAELLEQEASDRRRREREEARRRGAATGAPSQPSGEDMDVATVLATLDPALRQAILMEQDEAMLAQLPQDIAAEARALGGEQRLRHHFMDPSRSVRTRGVNPDDRNPESSKKSQKRTIVQMMDKSGIATLLRLMFIQQQGSARHTLNGILQNVCENRQNRNEIISLLLSILQDGCADTGSVERSFADLSIRARKPPLPRTPSSMKRVQLDSTPTVNTEMSPLMVIQQCLNTLVLLVNYNVHIPSYFLTEHETGIGLRRVKNKGKSKESKASRFALNSLLGLLDRKLIMESSTVMEQLSSLLNSVTQPLTILSRKDRESSGNTTDGNDQKTANAGSAESSALNEASTVDSGSAPTGTGPTLEQQEVSSTVVPAATGAAPEPSAPVDQEASDVRMTEDNAVTDSTTDTNAVGGKKEDTEAKKKQRTLTPPVVPERSLQLVVNILAARECSAKTFRDTLSTINNLSAIPGAKEVFGRELLRQAQDLGQSILDDLNELIPQIRSANTGTDVQGMALTKFSPASSDQAKLLRVLTALDYLFDTKKGGKDVEGSKENEAMLTSLYENSTFGPLWAKLSECLVTIRQRDNMLNVATILLPLIEALMVVCKNTTLKPSPATLGNTKELIISSPRPDNHFESLENLFFNFTEEHRKILNDLVRHNPKLMSGTFSLLVKNPKVLEFDNKRNYFTRRLHSRGTEARHPQPPLQLSVRRNQVFLDSFKSLYFKTGDEMKYGKMSIRFHGEEGVDAGGVTREWFQALSRQMFNPDYALFTPVASDRTTFHPNRFSEINPEHLMFFKFIGRIIGKALYEGRVLDCHFSRAVYKRILGKPVSVKDMETLDLDYYKSLVWMLENDITDIITETFSAETDRFGETLIVDLKENGRNIPVTEENKQEYVRLVVEYRLTGSVKDQLENFLGGFHDIVPAELISIFNEQELELLISGLPDIDVDDWRNNTEYHNYSASSSQIQWFWRAVRSFDKEERAKLLQFVTGTSKVPLNGFKELEGMNGFSRFNIHRDYGSKDRLPSSHTCFNQLDLPEYESYEALRKQVYTAMTAGSEYFGFA